MICNTVRYYFLPDIYMIFKPLLIIKTENYFGNSSYTLIFAVRF